jgi:hypothetical protein
MELDYLTMDSDEVKRAFALIGETERIVKTATENYVPSIRKERYLTGNEVCDYLHVSPRTLQTLRDTRQIPYTTVSERVFLYPESGIKEVLKRNYRNNEGR